MSEKERFLRITHVTKVLMNPQKQNKTAKGIEPDVDEYLWQAKQKRFVHETG